MTGRRRFNDRERAALWVVADGCCVLCGDPIAGSWHADHVEAYSRGGETDVTNGQALCPPCNLKKGDGVVLSGGWPVTRSLRGWQQECFHAFTALDAVNFLCVATPGSGKTTLALRIAHDLFMNGEIDRLVVVVPTDHLRRQWEAAASMCGIQLDPTWKNRQGREIANFDGVVVTYQSVASAPLVYRTQCGQNRTLVILDEIHHAGDSLAWGDNIRQAFEPAVRRLLLSGTPFRSDGKAIPFVRYENNICHADFAYDYGRAMADQVCRAVMFPRFDGEMQWWGSTGLTTATFRDELPEEEASRRLRTALDIHGDWLRDVIKDADAQLTEIRSESQPNAGGLVVCIDQSHARGIADLLHSITGVEPTVAISDDPMASDLIKRFDDSSDRWIVAVKMISEGVDIPRLRVGVYATNVISDLFFRQVVGRFVRKQIDVDEQVAYLFIPDDEHLRSYAEEIKKQRDGAIEQIERDVQEASEGKQREASGQPQLFVPGSSKAEFIGVIFGDERFEKDELDRAAALARQFGRSSRDDQVFAAQLLRAAGIAVAPPEPTTQVGPSVHHQRKALRDIRAVKVRQFVAILTPLTTNDRKDIFLCVNMKLKALTGGAKVEAATLAQLQEQNRLLDAWLTGINGAAQERRSGAWAIAWERGDYDG